MIFRVGGLGYFLPAQNIHCSLYLQSTQYANSGAGPCYCHCSQERRGALLWCLAAALRLQLPGIEISGLYF